MSPNPQDSCSCKKGKLGHNTKWPCEDWSDAATSKETDEAGEKPGTDPPEGAGLCWHLDLRLPASGTLRGHISVVLKHRVCGAFIMAAPGS